MASVRPLEHNGGHAIRDYRLRPFDRARPGAAKSSYFLKGLPAGQWVDAALYVLLGTLLLAVCLPQSRKLLS